MANMNPSEARAWLAGQDPPLDRVAEVERARALLAGGAARVAALLKPSLGEDLEEALVAEALAHSDADLILMLRDQAASKLARKLAGKAIYSLRSKGVAVEEAPRSGSGVSLALTPDPLPSFASTIDGSGAQILYVGGWSRDHGGAYCIVGIVSDIDGLTHVTLLPAMTRTRQRAIIEDLTRTFAGFVVEVPEAFAAGRVRWGLDAMRALGRGIDGDVADADALVREFEPVDSFELALDADDEAKLPALLGASEQLFTERAFQTWLVPSDVQFNALDARLHGVMHAGEAVTSERFQELFADRLSAFLDEWIVAAERVRLAARLEVMAWMLVLTERHETALMCVAVAHALRDEARRPSAIPFVRRALARFYDPEKLAEKAMAHDRSHGEAIDPIEPGAIV